MEPLSETRIDWTFIRFQFEVLGLSTKDIAEETPSLSQGLVEQAVKEGHWTAGNLDTLVPMVRKTPGEEESLETFTAALKAHLVGATLVKQRALFPVFAKCEAVLLSKILQAAQGVAVNDEKACNRLGHLVKSFQGLLAQNAFLTMQTATGEAGDGGNKITVQIMQQVN
jgi:hypothetical protein